eukprot:1726779-Alexandrium_andersonii.AAC.2
MVGTSEEGAPWPVALPAVDCLPCLGGGQEKGGRAPEASRVSNRGTDGEGQCNRAFRAARDPKQRAHSCGQPVRRPSPTATDRPISSPQGGLLSCGRAGNLSVVWQARNDKDVPLLGSSAGRTGHRLPSGRLETVECLGWPAAGRAESTTKIRSGRHDRLFAEEAPCPRRTPLLCARGRHDSSLDAALAGATEGTDDGGRLASAPQDAVDQPTVNTGDPGDAGGLGLRCVDHQLQTPQPGEHSKIRPADQRASAGVQLHHKAGCLGRTENGGARAPKTDQCRDEHGNVVNKGRRGGATGREGRNNDRVKGDTP